VKIEDLDYCDGNKWGSIIRVDISSARRNWIKHEANYISVWEEDQSLKL